MQTNCMDTFQVVSDPVFFSVLFQGRLLRFSANTQGQLEVRMEGDGSVHEGRAEKEGPI